MNSFDNESFTNNICRACMSQFEDTIAGNSMTESIFNQRNLENGTITIKELLQHVVHKLPKINQSDGLPKMICHSCLEKLIICYEFQKLCINSDEMLRSNLPNFIDEDVKYFPEHILNEMKDISRLIDPLQNKQIGAEIPPEEVKLEITIENDDETIVTNNSTTMTNSSSGYTDIKRKCIQEDKVSVSSAINCTFTHSGNENACESENDSYKDDNYDEPVRQSPSEKEIHPAMVKKKELRSDVKTEKTQSTDSSVNTTISGKVNCSICQNVFTSMKGMRKHTKRMHPEHYTPVPRSKFKPGEDSEYFKCDECDRCFAQKRYLKKHKYIHEKEIMKKTQTCIICNEELGSLAELRRHKNDVHIKEGLGISKPYFCKICNKDYKDHVSLRDHLMSIHNDEIPFLCQECGKAFNTKGNLRQHQLRHRGEKRFQCSVCIKKFPCSGDVSKHMKQVHAKLKPYVCDVCGSAFAQNYTLKKHKMRHSGEKPYPCEYCGLKFVTAHYLRRHMRTHTGEKPYKCTYCDRAFAQSNDLIKHLRSHLGENVYRCELCPKAFRLLSALREHWPEHKNEDEITRELNRQALLKEEENLQIQLRKSQETTMI